jgi:hypothetical protein
MQSELSRKIRLLAQGFGGNTESAGHSVRQVCETLIDQIFTWQRKEMNTQPEALRLADALETEKIGASLLDASAAELRRLHELAQEQHTKIYGLRLEVRNLNSVNADLLEAAKTIMENLDGMEGEVTAGYHESIIAPLRDAIAKATGAA